MKQLPKVFVYHVINRGNARQKVFRKEGDCEAFVRLMLEGRERVPVRLAGYCLMPDHVHALIKTPWPNLCRGMQHWLSGYANGSAKRNRRTGHLF